MQISTFTESIAYDIKTPAMVGDTPSAAFRWLDFVSHNFVEVAQAIGAQFEIVEHDDTSWDAASTFVGAVYIMRVAGVASVTFSLLISATGVIFGARAENLQTGAECSTNQVADLGRYLERLAARAQGEHSAAC